VISQTRHKNQYRKEVRNLVNPRGIQMNVDKHLFPNPLNSTEERLGDACILNSCETNTDTEMRTR